MRNIGPFGLENRIFAGICGLAALLVSLVLFGWGFFGALIFGIIVGVIVLMWLLMRADGAAETNTTNAASHGTSGAGTASASHGTTPAPQTDVTKTGSAGSVQASDTVDSAATTEAAPAAAPEAVKAPAATPAPAAEDAKATAPKVKDSAKLPGQDDLASRKGDWKYEGGDAAPEAAPTAKKAAPTAQKAAPAAKKPAKAKAADAASDGGNKDYDGDGVIEGANEGSKPATLTAARDGGADDLKQIKGVGPKMEGMLHGMGFFHFDQVAAWTGAEVAWVDANLKGFRGRVSRDNWVDQAKTLAAGGETEFSKKVEKGGVY